MNNRNNQNVEPGNPLAEILAVIPLVVWIVFLLLVLSFVMFAVWVNRTSMQGFTSDVLQWGLYLLIVVGVLIAVKMGYRGYELYHDARMKSNERQTGKIKIERLSLQNRTLQAQLSVLEQAPALIKYAIDAGHNVEMDAKGQIKVTNAIASVQALPPGDVSQIASPSIVGKLPLPGSILAKDVMQSFDLRDDHFFLALGKGNDLLTCTLKGFMHTAHDASTGGGKTSQQRLEIVQHIKLGIYVILAFPHFAPITEDGEDWRPIGRAIEKQGMLQVTPTSYLPGLMRKSHSILKVLKWLSESELERRYAMRERGDFSYPSIVMFIDELPFLTGECPDIATYMIDVIRRGRVVNVRINTSAQDFLVKTVGMSGGARENFNTAYYMGGSDYSGSTLLDMKQKDIPLLLKEEGVTLGRGIALLRNNESVPMAQLVRLPYADNDFVYYMLGHADEWILPSLRTQQRQEQEQEDTPYHHASMPRVVTGSLSNLQLEPAFHSVDKEQQRIQLQTILHAVKEYNTTNKRFIASKTGIDESTVYLRIKRLQELGYIPG